MQRRRNIIQPLDAKPIGAKKDPDIRLSDVLRNRLFHATTRHRRSLATTELGL